MTRNATGGETAVTPQPQLLYFDIRGRAEPIRLLMEEVGVAYEDV